MDVLSGSSHLKGNNGTLIERANVFQKPVDDFKGRLQSNGALQIVVDEDPEYLRNLGDQEVEVIEENTVGQVVQGDDGEYYVVVDDSSPDVSGIQQVGTPELVSSEDGTHAYLVHNTDIGEATRENISNEQVGYARTVEGVGDRPQSSRRDLKTVFMDPQSGMYEMVHILEDDEGIAVDSRGEPINIGAITTAEVGEALGVNSDPFPQGIKMRRNRVYGQCRCSECGQSFVNTARLERHLAVHQIFGSFLCPLCGKTYKYEYNLFYHWRRTCRDLNELVSLDDRKTMEVNALRQLVEDVALKKAEIGPVEIGINRNFLFGTSPYARLELPTTSIGCRGTTCRVCGVIVPSVHLSKHLSVHRGESVIDDRIISGGFFCDLCGIMFRQHFNLIKHWRTSCPEIQANLPEDQDITMDDDGLKRMVTRLMRRSPEDMEEGNMPIESDPRPPDGLLNKTQLTGNNATQTNTEAEISKVREISEEALNEVTTNTCQEGAQDLVERTENAMLSEDRQTLDPYEGKWTEDQGIVFADDFLGDEDSFMLSGDGMTAAQNRAKWSLSGGPVQCPECFRSFANSGRLERHLAGFHASFGSHHCILCGNRFKYDYNLLYHYRRSCPYTRAFIDHDVREQIDAMNLRKLVRNLSQKEVNLMPHMLSKNHLPYRDPVDIIGSRRQLLRYPTPANQPPPHLLVPRPGLGRGKSCPVCSVIFYGNVAIERHLKAAHPVEYEEWNLQGLLESSYLEENGRRIVMQEMIDEPEEIVEEDAEEVSEPPPTLTAELPVEQPVVSSSQGISVPGERTIRRAHIEEDEHGNQRIVDENGVLIEGADGEVPLQIEDNENLRQFIESVQLQVPDGEIIFVEENETNGYEGNIKSGHIITANGDTYVTAGEFVDGSNNVNKFFVKNGSFTDVQSSSSQESGKASDVGLEVATILTRMKKQDDERNLNVRTVTEEQASTSESDAETDTRSKNYLGQCQDSDCSRHPAKPIFNGDTVQEEIISSEGIAVSQGSPVGTIVVEEDLATLVKRPRLSGIS